MSPEKIFQVATGFMAAKHLFVASEIGLFAALGDGPATLDDLASRLNVPRRTLRIIADAMTVLGFATRDGDRYANAEVAQTFLSGKGAVDMRPHLKFWNRLSYPNWMNLESSVRTGQAAARGGAPSDEDMRILSDGVEAINAGAAAALPSIYDFGAHKKLLNLGGWYVSFLLPVLEKNPELSATLVMLPQWYEKARQRLENSAIASRVTLVEGDYLSDELPKNHDVVVVANIAHHMSSQQNCEFLEHVRSYVEPGAKLVFIDFWTNATHTEPPFAALMAGEFLALSGDGDVYSFDEVRDWFDRTGWKEERHGNLSGPSFWIVARAV